MFLPVCLMGIHFIKEIWTPSYHTSYDNFDLTVLSAVLGTIWPIPIEKQARTIIVDEINSLDVEQPCQTFGDVSIRFNMCTRLIPYISTRDYREGRIFANTLRENLAQKCCPEVMKPYLDCIRNMTEICPPEKRDAVRREAIESYAICDGPDTVANWITEYALRDFAFVDLPCRDYNETLRISYPKLQYPTYATPFEEGMRELRSNMEIIFNDIEEYAMNVVQNRPGCSTQVVDSLSAFIIEMFGTYFHLGFKMLPEQIAKLKELRDL